MDLSDDDYASESEESSVGQNLALELAEIQIDSTIRFATGEGWFQGTVLEKRRKDQSIKVQIKNTRRIFKLQDIYEAYILGENVN